MPFFPGLLRLGFYYGPGSLRATHAKAAAFCKMCSCDLDHTPLAETFTMSYLFVAELQNVYFQTKTFLPSYS